MRTSQHEPPNLKNLFIADDSSFLITHLCCGEILVGLLQQYLLDLNTFLMQPNLCRPPTSFKKLLITKISDFFDN